MSGTSLDEIEGINTINIGFNKVKKAETDQDAKIIKNVKELDKKVDDINATKEYRFYKDGKIFMGKLVDMYGGEKITPSGSVTNINDGTNRFENDTWYIQYGGTSGGGSNYKGWTPSAGYYVISFDYLIESGDKKSLFLTNNASYNNYVHGGGSGNAGEGSSTTSKLFYESGSGDWKYMAMPFYAPGNGYVGIWFAHGISGDNQTEMQVKNIYILPEKAYTDVERVFGDVFEITGPLPSSGLTLVGEASEDWKTNGGKAEFEVSQSSGFCTTMLIAGIITAGLNAISLIGVI